MRKVMERFAADESGSYAVECGVIAGLASLSVLTGSSPAGMKVNVFLSEVGTAVSSFLASVTG